MADVGVNCPREALHFEGYRAYFDVLVAMAGGNYQTSAASASAGIFVNFVFVVLIYTFCMYL